MFNIKDILLVLRRRLKLIILLGILGMGVAAFITYTWVQPTYSSSASFYVINDDYRASSEISSGELSASQRLVQTYIVVLKSETTMRQVSQRLEELGYYYSTGALLGMTYASSINNTEAFRVTVTSTNAELAKTVVTIILDVLPAELIRVVEAGSVKVIDTASQPTKAAYPIKKNVVMGMAVGVVIAVAYALLYAIFDNRVHDEEDLKRVFTIPIVGFVPSYRMVKGEVQMEKAKLAKEQAKQAAKETPEPQAAQPAKGRTKGEEPVNRTEKTDGKKQS